MNVEIRLGAKDEARIIRNLWPLYQHDVSAFDGAVPNRHGVFGSDATTTLAEHVASLDPWWDDLEALFLYLIVVDGAPAGFDLIAARPRLPPGIDAGRTWGRSSTRGSRGPAFGPTEEARVLGRADTTIQVPVVRRLVAEGRFPRRRVWGMLALRSVVSLTLLLAVAWAYALLGRPDPVAASSAWWLWFATAANVASIALMVRFARLEGLRLRDVYFFDRSTWRGDLVWAGVA